MKPLFDTISYDCSRNITKTYSTSFSLGIYLLAPQLRDPIYGIYGFVRIADEIVNSFEGYDQQQLLEELRKDTFEAIARKISVNPVLNAFQHVVHEYGISNELIISFLDSMEMDLDKQQYTKSLYEKYIYGSAEVVGLMCLKVFTSNHPGQYDELKPYAMKLGSAFQKINFLRDLKADYQELKRSYFPSVDFSNFSDVQKREIEEDIEKDFADGLRGIKKLPREARFGVFLAYVYYQALFKKIRKMPSNRIMEQRIRVSNRQKAALLAGCYLRNLTMIRRTAHAPS